MNGQIPHIVQYQGSKRILAPKILQYVPKSFNRLLEPFAGMAAITVAIAAGRRAKEYYVNDINRPVVSILESAVQTPRELVEAYGKIWSEQFEFPAGHVSHYYHIRDRFNNGEQTPENMLYLLARCVKGSVRYSRSGQFNQSPDKRRNGTNPINLSKNVNLISLLLNKKCKFSSLDYREILEMARPGDLIYMDPPYQGVSSSRDGRYCNGLDFDEFVESIRGLNSKGVDYLISYDGKRGDKEYGFELPKELRCAKILLEAGLSTQSTLLGERDITFESLYVSNSLHPYVDLAGADGTAAREEPVKSPGSLLCGQSA